MIASRVAFYLLRYSS